jgi:hypothetical protein
MLVCSRYPHNLANDVPWEQVQDGVYRCRRGTDVIQVVVAGQLPHEEHNAMLHLFSASGERVRYGAEHYRQRGQDTSSLLQELIAWYKGEGVAMPYTMEDFRRNYAKQHLKDLTPEERLGGLTAEELLKGLSPEQIQQLLQRLQAAGGPPSKTKKKK